MTFKKNDKKKPSVKGFRYIQTFFAIVLYSLFWMYTYIKKKILCRWYCINVFQAIADKEINHYKALVTRMKKEYEQEMDTIRMHVEKEKSR